MAWTKHGRKINQNGNLSFIDNAEILRLRRIIKSISPTSSILDLWNSPSGRPNAIPLQTDRRSRRLLLRCSHCKVGIPSEFPPNMKIQENFISNYTLLKLRNIECVYRWNIASCIYYCRFSSQLLSEKQASRARSSIDALKLVVYL